MTISNCGHDENNKYSGGTAGDQSGTEYYIRSWYSGFTRVYRHPDSTIRSMIAEVATKAAQNDNIGYDQNQRLTYYNRLKEASWKPENITEACEADCSSSTAAAVIAAGNRCNNSKCANVGPSMTTYNEDSELTGAGFTKLTASKYLNSDSYLLAGDILWKSGHTAIVVTDGANASSETASTSTSSSTSTSNSSSSNYSTGNYTTIVDNLNVRTGAGTNYSVKNKSQLTSNAQANCNSSGQLNKGTVVTVSKVSTDSSGNPWGQIPSGWICLEYNGTAYVKKGSSSSSSTSSSSNSSSSSSSYSTGTYVTIVDNLNVRTGAGTNYSKKSKSQLTTDGKKHANSSGQLNKGTTVTVSTVSKDSSGNFWGQIPSGWICLEYGGTAYVKKK